LSNWLSRKSTSVTLLAVIVFSFWHSADLSALPDLNPSLIDNIYDIPLSIPLATNTSTPVPENERYSLDLGPEAGVNQSPAGDTSAVASCEKLPVRSVNAIGSDGHVPSNVIDNNLDTRWSNNGVGSWIQLDLGSKKSICSVDIAWYRGSVGRQNNFVISVDGFSGKSSGTTAGLEKYDMSAAVTDGRYVRVTVNGNNENDWASITEIEVFGSDSSTPPPPPPTNQPPTADSKSVTTSMDTPVDITLSGQDPEGGPLKFSIADQPKHGTLGSTTTPQIYIYTPTAGYTGSDSFTYVSIDEGATSSSKATVSVTVSESPPQPPSCPDLPDDGRPQPEKGANPDPGTWSVVPMQDDPSLFKIVDNANINVADLFHSQLTAQQYIDHFKCTPAPPPPPPPPPNGDTNDKFGIKKIYPTKPGGEEWYMDMQDPENDPRTKQIPMSKNSDGSWNVNEDQIRYRVHTSSGYHPDDIVKDHSILAERGYMQYPNDWKNVEMTGQVRFNSGDDDDWTWYARGGRNTADGWPEGCEASEYKGSLEYTSGRVRWAKEQYHVSYVFSPWKNSPALGDGKFVGFKTVMYNFQLDGKTAVKMESYVDPNNDNQWQKVYDWVDKGGWGSDGGECKGAPDQIITWGGPAAVFRWDNANIDIKNLSVREIVPPSPTQ
jgi:hypothetical protein